MPVPRLLPSLSAACAAVTLTASASAASSVPQDMFEPNDDCIAPPFVNLGSTPGLTLGPDDDYFTISVPPNAEITIDALSGLGVSLDVTLFEPGCGTQLASAVGAQLSYFDCGSMARDLIVLVPGAGMTNEPYTLDVSAVEIVDDAFEDNDTCASGAMVAIQSFTTAGLVVTGCDEDHYIARLQRANVELQVDVLFSQAEGDIDIELLEFQNGMCTGNVLASSTSTTDNESVSYVNMTNPSMAEAVVIRVYMKNGVGHSGYALTACFGDRTIDPLIGTQGCAGVVNSTGRPATLCALGSDVALDNDVKLYCVDLPANSVGYFITAPGPGFAANPGGSLGNLCLGAPGRYSTIVLPTGTGAVFFQPNLTTIPVAGGGTTSLGAGDRQLWQFWHRDFVGGPVSNFSSAIDVTFQ